MKTPRVAFFTDSFYEVNGVALTSRAFDEFARLRGYPFLSVHTGPESAERAAGVHRTIEIERGRWLLELEHDLAFDLMFWRHRRELAGRVRVFQPDLVHITGPSHLGMLGAMVAHDLRVPLVASWHTNIHEFAGRRLDKLLQRWPAFLRRGAVRFADARSLDLAIRFYQLARLLFAPNPELVELLEKRAGRPAYPMLRGIDTNLFDPQRRKRTDNDFVVGYVGRLSPEKNVRLLAELERKLIEHGVENYRFLIVGEGSERGWLTSNMKRARLPGVLRGELLAAAYAEMDAFVFPSQTDTFGNVVLEALASGVPAIVDKAGGPKFLVENGSTGFIAGDKLDFVNAILLLHRDEQLRASMRQNARQAACQRSWDVVFSGVYERYAAALASGALAIARQPDSNAASAQLRSRILT